MALTSSRDMHRLSVPVALFLSFLMASAAVFSTSDALAQAANAGGVTNSSGSVQIQRGAATIPAGAGTLVQVGDRIITGVGAHVLVTLTDGSTLELGDSSSAVIDQHAGAATRVSMFGGVLRSFVNRTIGVAAPNFEVHTPNAVAAARGTRFDVAYQTNISRPTYGDCHDFTDTSVYEGVVNLSNVNNPAGGVDIPAGYEATVPCGFSPSGAGPLGMTGASAFGPGGGGLSNTAVLSPVTTVPAPSCPVC